MRNYPRKAWIAIFAALPWVANATENLHYLGIAYDAHSGQKLYQEEHFVFDQNDQRTRLVLYRCPSGQPFARKWVRGAASASDPDFDLVDARTGYREGVSGPPGARKVYVQVNDHSPLRSAPLEMPVNAVIDAGFDAYVRDHFDSLDPQARLAFLVPSRLGYMDLRLTDTSSAAGRRHIRLSLDTWYGFAAPSINLTYDTADRRLVQFKGISNIHDASGGSQTVRIEFPVSAEQPAPTPQDIRQAAGLPLVNRCPP
ncbi:hypothetical protein [Dyella acidiphila]|uniref:Secreted protein n=1 Tax=Dyella acidiphila TaxID=2775866 RepID=A0ABR9GD09_9GAMM|nr:hypothetical protein [Dyella acidiphila]MBE1161937.1 hypothetical protein [Dyella acidiphila]